MVFVKLLIDLKKERIRRFAMEEKPVDPMADYLRSWGLQMYIEKFAEHAIDAETLQMLSEEDIKDLIPIIGHRAKLVAHLKLLKNIMSDTNSPIHEEESANQIFNIQDLPVLTDSTLKELPYNSTDEIEAPVNTCELYKTLKECNEGKGLLLRYEASGILNNAARRRLCNIIISNELKDDPEKRITSSRFFQLSFEINQVFKKESSAIYFTPFTSFNPRQKISAKGKLLDYYRQKRRDFINTGVIQKNSYCSSSSETESVHPSTSQKDAINKLETQNNSDIEDKLQWLRNCSDPWYTVELYWEITTKERLNLLASSAISIDKFFQDFRALNHQRGMYLLLKDFKSLYPNNDNKLNCNWHTIQEKIINYANTKTDRIIKDFLKILMNDEEAMDLATFMALPFLMSTHTIVTQKKGKRHHWRPSKQEVLDAFMTSVQSAAEIEEVITRRRENLQLIELNLQPFIIVVVSSNKVSACFVIVNNIRYEVPSVLKAVDACFKIIFVLNAKYPAECKHVWQFIQKSLFELDTKYDKIHTTVNTLMSELNIQHHT